MMNDVNRRDRDFLRAVRREAVRGSREGRPMTVRQAVSLAVASPAPSYYLSTEYAWRKLRYQRELRSVRRPRRAGMWEELRQRYERELAARPGEDPYAVLDELLNRGEAPRFFISEARGVSLYFKLLTNVRNGNKSKQ